MLIQPVQPVMVTVKIGESKFDCQMLSLSENELEITSSDYLEKESSVSFFAKYFRGSGIIREIKFAQYCFTYKMDIEKIQFQPGLIINTKL